jgi:hypothetical protein
MKHTGATTSDGNFGKPATFAEGGAFVVSVAKITKIKNRDESFIN